MEVVTNKLIWTSYKKYRIVQVKLFTRKSYIHIVALFTAICLEYAKLFSCLQYPYLLLEHIATPNNSEVGMKTIFSILRPTIIYIYKAICPSENTILG